MSGVRTSAGNCEKQELTQTNLEEYRYREESKRKEAIDLVEAGSLDEAERKVTQHYEQYNGTLIGCYVLSCEVKEVIR